MSKIEDKRLELELPDKRTGGITIGLLGSTRSGKTTLLKYLLEKYFEKYVTVLMSASMHAHVYDDIDENIIKSPDYYPNIVKEMYSINRKIDNHYQFLNVMDDIVNKKFDKELLKAFTIYRNSGISSIICIQDPVLLNTAVRGNLNIVLLGFFNSDEKVEKAIRGFCYASIPGKNIQEKIVKYKELTKDHHFL
jgi:hypothetical protein